FLLEARWHGAGSSLRELFVPVSRLFGVEPSEKFSGGSQNRAVLRTAANMGGGKWPKKSHGRPSRACFSAAVASTLPGETLRAASNSTTASGKRFPLSALRPSAMCCENSAARREAVALVSPGIRRNASR